jgi:hypothetical protein
MASTIFKIQKNRADAIELFKFVLQQPVLMLVRLVPAF